jgi:hypothetical protein
MRIRFDIELNSTRLIHSRTTKIPLELSFQEVITIALPFMNLVESAIMKRYP